MVSNNEKLIELIKKNNDKQIILYGAASRGIRVFYNLIQKGVDKNQILFCDSNEEKMAYKIFRYRNYFKRRITIFSGRCLYNYFKFNAL